MFLGTWEYAIDAKGQIALPPSFCAALHEGCIITRGFDGCLQGFALPAWGRLAQRVSGLPLGVAQARSLRRLLFGSAAELHLDSHGRARLPDDLLAHARLADAAVIAGLDSYFEIWAPARWHGETQLFQQLAPTLFDLPLLLSHSPYVAP